MSRIIFCITNDIEYDRRVQRTMDALLARHQVTVISRKLHAAGKGKINCMFNNGFLFYAEFNIRLFFLLLFRATDVIVAIDYDTLVACGLASMIKRKKLVFDAHELFEESVEIVNRPKVKKFWEWIGKRFIRRVDRAYTVSNSIARYYEDRYKIPFQVVRNVPKKLDFSLRPSDKKIILYQGVLNKGRMLEELVQLPHFLPDDYEVWIIGEGDISRKLRQMAHNAVVFYSWVKPERLHKLTTQAFLTYNLLDQSSLSYYFSAANKFFDYIQAGVPSLNSEFPEYIEINERYNCCYINDVKTSRALGEWILEIGEKENEYREKRKNSFIAASDLNWGKESKKLIEIYDFHSNSDI